MFISYISKFTNSFQVHETPEEAVSYILDQLGTDYANDFWASPEGDRIVKNPGSRLDFSVAVYRGVREALEAHLDLDEEALAYVARQLGQTVTSYFKGVSHG